MIRLKSFTCVFGIVTLLVSGCTVHSSANPNQVSQYQLQDTKYFNCSNPTGCLPVPSTEPTSDTTQTQYPIVLAHGLGGWNQLFKFVEYFNGIPEVLVEGGAEVYVTKTSAIHNAEFRGEQLLQQVRLITDITGKDKVNLIGHSLGGVDIRYVAAIDPGKVASVTAVASPEQGSKMADWVFTRITEGSRASGYAEGEYNVASKTTIAFFKFIGDFMDIGSGIQRAERQPQDSMQSARGLTSDYMANYFNVKYPAAVPNSYCAQPPANHIINGIAYYSFTGVGVFTNHSDPSDYMLSLTSKAFGQHDPNDGLVSVCSSRLGYVIRDDYNMNHLDSINQVLGLTAMNEVNPVTIYRNHVNRLKNTGF